MVHITQNLTLEKSRTYFDDWQLIRQNFSHKPSPLSVFLMKATINPSKFCECSIHQISPDFYTIKVLRYRVTNILYTCHHNLGIWKPTL